jgi:pentatricopeptide repeat protein
MFNTAISALGKALQVEAAEALFSQMPAPDAVSHETLIAAYGMSGRAEQAEAAFSCMRAAGFAPRDYAYCGLIAAHSFQGDWRAALRVQERMAAAGAPPSVHTYNALIAACDRAHQYERAMSLARDMQRAGVHSNSVTQMVNGGLAAWGLAACNLEAGRRVCLPPSCPAPGLGLWQPNRMPCHPSASVP